MKHFQARHADASEAARLLEERRPRLLARRRERRRARMIKLRHRGVTAVLGAAMVTFGAAAAYAYLSVTGSVDVSASVVGPQISADAGQVSGLYPGATSAAVIHVTNGADLPYRISGMTPTAAGVGNCTAGAFTVTTPTELPTVAPTSTATITVGVGLATDAPSACQGATVTIPVHVTGSLTPGAGQ